MSVPGHLVGDRIRDEVLIGHLSAVTPFNVEALRVDSVVEHYGVSDLDVLHLNHVDIVYAHYARS